jgi:hypothetical protein
MGWTRAVGGKDLRVSRKPVKVPLAHRIDNWRDVIRDLNVEAQNVVRALQI